MVYTSALRNLAGFQKLIPLTSFLLCLIRQTKMKPKKETLIIGKVIQCRVIKILSTFYHYKCSPLLSWKNDPCIQLIIGRPLSLNRKFLCCRFYTRKTKVVSQNGYRNHFRRQNRRINKPIPFASPKHGAIVSKICKSLSSFLNSNHLKKSA